MDDIAENDGPPIKRFTVIHYFNFALHALMTGAWLWFRFWQASAGEFELRSLFKTASVAVLLLFPAIGIYLMSTKYFQFLQLKTTSSRVTVVLSSIIIFIGIII